MADITVTAAKVAVVFPEQAEIYNVVLAEAVTKGLALYQTLLDTLDQEAALAEVERLFAASFGRVARWMPYLAYVPNLFDLLRRFGRWSAFGIPNAPAGPATRVGWGTVLRPARSPRRAAALRWTEW